MKTLSLILLIFIFPSSSFASSIWCTGTVSNIYIDSTKNVMIRGGWRNEYTRICRTDGAGGIDTVTCSLWVSLVTTAMTNNKTVTLMYDDQNSALTCETLLSYTRSPQPYYVMLNQ